MTRTLPSLLLATLALAACGEQAKLPENRLVGPDPSITPPVKTLIPTVKVAPAVGWPQGRMPAPAAGLRVQPFATGLDHPRWLHVLPNGDVLVAESNKPKPEGPEADKGGIKKWVMGKLMARAGAGTPSAERISLLRDADGDGTAETKTVFLQSLKSPFGMALVGSELFVANADAVLRFPYTAGATRIEGQGSKVVDLPAGINHHWTKALIAARDGSKLYATVGSNSNVGENGMAMEEGRAAIWEIDPKANSKRLYAGGLRNPNGMAWEPGTGALWTAVNERDEIGSDLVPDYITSVKDGGFYGWPWAYWGQHVDERVQPPRPDMVAKTLKPDYAVGTHVAPLGLAASEGASLPAPFAGGGMFVGLHGSWNRKPPAGYKVVFVPFAGGKPAGPMHDVLAGFLNDEGEAMGRPVGVAVDKRGALLVADDVGNTVWRVSAAAR